MRRPPEEVDSHREALEPHPEGQAFSQRVTPGLIILVG